jgi:hypothetical protein
MAIQLGDIVRVTLHQRMDGQVVNNVLHYRCDGEDTTIGEDILNSWIGNNIVTPMKALQSANIVHDSITTQKIWPLPALLAVESTAFSGFGAVAGESLPTECTVVFTKMTQFASRKYRGRVYVGGLAVSDVTGSEIAAARQAAWKTLEPKWYLGVVVGGSLWRFSPGLFHRKDGAFTPLQQALLRPTIRCQRRRQLGKGV